jgi:hypothetical protein
MLTPGNHKLGGRLIWGFGLPSGAPDVCPGASDTCRIHCYARAFERYRPATAARYRRNLALARRRDFVPLMRAVLVLHDVRVVRLHVGGDFFSARYARRWLRIMRYSPRTRFYFYSRSWCVAAIKTVIDRMAELPNCRAWYSLDRDTGVPAEVPPRVRLAWLMTAPDEAPPAGTGLVFRVRRLRRRPASVAGPPVCPAEDGVGRPNPVTCDRCGYCWRPAVAGRIALPVIDRASFSPGRGEGRGA